MNEGWRELQRIRGGIKCHCDGETTVKVVGISKGMAWEASCDKCDRTAISKFTLVDIWIDCFHGAMRRLVMKWDMA